MFSKIIKSVVKKSIKDERYFLSSLIISMYNKLNIPINPKVFNNVKYNGKNALDWAILGGNCDTVKLYLKNGARLNLDVKNTISCLNIVIAEKNVKVLEVLMEHIHNRNFFQNTDYDKKVASLLNANDVTKKCPLVTAIDLFLKSNDTKEKEVLKECMKLIYNNQLFDKNNSEFYNNLWKGRANYFIDYDERVLNSVENYILSTKNEELIKFFIDNGLRYIDESILCVNTRIYTHSAMILKFNEPIKVKDSNHDIAGILYSFEIKNKSDNTKKTICDKTLHCMTLASSFVTPVNSYMKRVLLTSEDLSKILKDGETKTYRIDNIKGKDVIKSLSEAYETIDKLKKTESFTNARLIKLLRKLTSNIENVAYLFSLYSKNANNFIEKDRIKKCDFVNEIPILTIDNNKDEGYSIYDFIWKKPKELNISYKQKILAIEEFLNVECIKVLTQNKIIGEDSITFDIEDFGVLSKRIPNDLFEKCHYSKVYKINLATNHDKGNILKDYEIAICGHKLISILEEYNVNVETYSFLKNNCITTLKKALSECGYKNYIKEADRELNICQKRHPLSVLKRLKEMEFCRQ